MFHYSKRIVRRFLVLKNKIYLDISLKILLKKDLVGKKKDLKKNFNASLSSVFLAAGVTTNGAAHIEPITVARINCKAISTNIIAMAIRKGLEPSTSCVTGRHSNQLNYRTASVRFCYKYTFNTTF